MLLQVLDVDYEILNGKPIIRIFGKNTSNMPYCLFVENYFPFFYVLPKSPENKEDIIKKLDQKFTGEIRKIEEVEKFLPVGYTKDKSRVLRIESKNPSKVPLIRDFLSPIVKEVYEADILFKYRFMSDKNIKGMEWLRVAGKPAITNVVKCKAIKPDQIQPLKMEKTMPFKILALDIEISAPNDRIGDPQKDPIILIGLSFSEPYKNKKTLVLSAKPVKGEDVLGFEDEKDMLKNLKEIIDDFDPDIITGYNINNFDMPYILDRLQKLGIKKDLGRVRDKSVFYKKMGAKTRINITGRIIADSYQLVKSNFSFKRYTLKNVSKMLLDAEKLDVDYKEINKLWNGDEKQIKKLIDYTRRDSLLALHLITKKNLLDKYVAVSKVCGTLIQDVLDGGETIRIENLILSEFNKKDFLISCKPGQREIEKRTRERKKKGIKGGLVLKPETGLHADTCTLVLDFRSLYPSIFRTYNVCFTTLLRDGNAPHYESPAGIKFVKEEVREGIIPNILKKLIEERIKTKKELKVETDPERKKLLDFKQYALKIMANAFYGYTGYIRARAYVIDIANAVTSYGRYIIDSTRRQIETKYKYKIIYGDTDSVMIGTDTKNPDEAFKIGEKIAREITQSLPGELELEFEKIFRTFLILTKKRYAGWSFQKVNGEWKNKIEMKGIETVRRDWCDIVEETMKEILKIILKEGNVEKAVSYMKKRVREVREGNVELRKLAITKGITKKIESYEGMLPHIELAKKIQDRNPKEKPSPGDRLSFVIIRGNQMLSKRAESLSYVKEKNLPIDSDYYINSQLLPPIERIFSVMNVDKNELLGRGRQFNLVESANGSKRERNHNTLIEKNPSDTVIKNPIGFVCRKCNKNYKRVPLTGKCNCGGELFIYGPGSLGKFAEV